MHWKQKLVSGYLGYKCKPQPHLVVDAYFNALTSAWPRRRYQIGYDAMFQVSIKYVLTLICLLIICRLVHNFVLFAHKTPAKCLLLLP